MPKKPCQWCGEPIPSGWSDHRCPEGDQAMKELREAAGVEDDEAEHNDEHGNQREEH